MPNRRKRRVFSREFKKQVVDMHKSGKSRKEIINDYDLTPSAFDNWVNEFAEFSLIELNHDSQSQGKKEQEQLTKLKKENEKLLLENNILKQTVLIFGKMVE